LPRKELSQHGVFTFRVKMGEYELEISGTREEVMDAIGGLPEIVVNVDKAFEKVRPKKVTTLTVKTEPATLQKRPTEEYPQISRTEKRDEAVLNLLATDWGKWRPRTIDELNEALKTNRIETPLRTLSTILMDLVKKEKIVRWQTDSGYVYILAEKEAVKQKGDAGVD
jgi:predicted transcriptional regulator